ncbi:MAG: hypothetical protein FWC70_06210 [Defluviitaleaceae bacterium]|nr:hypothetical protein [Defluviitaleaceae bacterium]
MKTFSQQNVIMPQLSDVRCNSCGKDVDKNEIGYFEDHISLSKLWGYHSPFDGESHDIDLCVDCYKNWITGFEIPPYPEPV